VVKNDSISLVKSKLRNIRVVQYQSLRDYPSDDIWWALQTCSIDSVDIHGDIDRVVISTNIFDDKDSTLDIISFFAEEYDSQAGVLSDFINHVERCLLLGVDFIEIS